MKIQKFNEALSDYSDYKEYDEYSNLNIDVINNWNSDFSEVNDFLLNFNHEIHQYSDFIRDYVVCNNKNTVIIPNDIRLLYSENYKKFKIYFYDSYNDIYIETTEIKYFKNISEIAETDQVLFMKLYNTYVEEFGAPYMDVFGKDEFKHLFVSKKFNL
jgi:hypothetical protein